MFLVESVVWKDRLPSAALALLLQALFIAAFLHAFSQGPLPRRELAHEITFFLPHLLKPEPVPSNQARRATTPALTPPVFALPPVAAVPLPEAPSAQALQNFGQALQGCAPESYADFTPDRKARCARPGDGVAVQQAPNLMGSPSHVKDEAHWEDEWAREQSPVLLPCLGGLDVACLIGMIAGDHAGDLGDPRKWPHYQVDQLPKGDFYKVEQAYDAWHKDHPDAQASTKAAETHPQ